MSNLNKFRQKRTAREYRNQRVAVALPAETLRTRSVSSGVLAGKPAASVVKSVTNVR